MKDDRPNTFEKLLEDFKQQRLTYAEFEKAIETIVQHIKKVEGQFTEALDTVIETVNDKLEQLSTEQTTSLSDVKGLTAAEAASMRQQVADALKSIQDYASTLRSGVDADEGRVIETVRALLLSELPAPLIETVTKNLPAAGQEVRNALELLPEGEKLAIDAIEGLKDLLEELQKRKAPQILAGGPHYLAGSGVSINGNIISATGSGTFGIITVTGDIDDSNTSFTAASEPTVVVVNGATYRNGKGATISGTSITLDNPVGTGGDIYAL